MAGQKKAQPQRRHVYFQNEVISTMREPEEKRDISGFTLIEILISSAIAAIILSAIFSIYKTGSDLWDIKSSQADLQGRARVAIEQMTKELKSATRTSSRIPSPNLIIPAAPNNINITFYLPNDLDADGRITDNTTGLIEWDTNNAIQYQYDSGEKTLTRLADSTTATIARDVTDIQFIDASIDSQLYLTELKIILTLTKTTPSQRMITTAQTSMVKLRN
jgi:prepilin-type N-terminal cleavage/methylation domain-containing protein